MVCNYCGGETAVINSRHQKRSNRVWRRRKCLACNSVVSTLEALDYAASLSLQTANGTFTPFLRDKLFVSVLDSLRHRKSAVTDATALTETILGRLSGCLNEASAIDQLKLIELAGTTLDRFDSAAGVYYRSYHPLHK